VASELCQGEERAGGRVRARCNLETFMKRERICGREKLYVAREEYVNDTVCACGFTHWLTLVPTQAEKLPVSDKSIDVVVSVCALCSVQDAGTALSEILRVLKPGGRLLFWEHICSETSADTAIRQRECSEIEESRWGCRFDRHTYRTILGAGFSQVHGSYFELPGFDLMASTVLGCAVK